MDWNINMARGTARAYDELRKRIRRDNYGFDAEAWNLTDCLHEEQPLGTMALQIIGGDQPNGKPDPLHRGIQRQYRLRVLSRQACAVSADGKYINGWSAGNKCKREQTPDNTIFPAHDEPPVPGDIVRVKVGFVPGLTPQKRDKMIARGEPHYLHDDLVVDDDLCVTCDFVAALQLLRANGKRIIFPEYRRPDRALENLHIEGRGPKPRTITQWHFEEVPQDYKAPAKRGRKPKTDPVADNGEVN